MPVHVVEKLNKIGRTERELRAELGREPERARDRQRARSAAGGDRADPQERADADLTREAGRRRGRVRVRALPHRRDCAAAGRDGRGDAAQRGASLDTGVRSRIASGACSSCARPRRRAARTLDEIGRAFNVTRERIRQIENQGLKKLRALALAAQLRDARSRGGGEVSREESQRSPRHRCGPRRSRPCRPRTRLASASLPRASPTASHRAASRRRAGS